MARARVDLPLFDGPMMQMRGPSSSRDMHGRSMPTRWSAQCCLDASRAELKLRHDPSMCPSELTPWLVWPPSRGALRPPPGSAVDHDDAALDGRLAGAVHLDLRGGNLGFQLTLDRHVHALDGDAAGVDDDAVIADLEGDRLRRGDGAGAGRHGERVIALLDRDRLVAVD